MSTTMRTQIAHELLTTQQQLLDFFATVAAFQDWQPARDQWSFRQVASHLATAEAQCLYDRVRQIAAGSNPRFSFYLDTETEFSERSLADSLQQWVETRRDILAFVNALPEASLAYTGQHLTFGPLTVLGYLRVFLDHDQRHLQELEQLRTQYWQGQR
jgi:hypothetical protein